MFRPSTLLLPLLLTLPPVAWGQGLGQKSSPALRGDLLAQAAPQVPAAAETADIVEAAPEAQPAAVPQPAPAVPAPAAQPPARPSVVPPSSAQPPANNGNGGRQAGGGRGFSGRGGRGNLQGGQAGAADGGAARPRTGIPLPGATGGAVPGAGNGRVIPPTGRSTQPPGTRAADSAAPASAQGLPLDPDNKYGDIAWVNEDINIVISKYEEISRHHVIRGPNLTGTVTIVANPNPERPFTDKEAADFIRIALGVQGFVIQRYNDTIDKMVVVGNGGAPPGIYGAVEGFPLYTRKQKLPEDDRIINFVLTLDNLPVIEASQVIAQAVPVAQWAKYVVVPSANSIFIQEYVSNIRTLLKVVDTIDLPAEKPVHVWVELERASAEDVQAILDQILQAQAKGAGSTGGSGFRSIAPGQAVNNLPQPGGVATQPGGGGGALVPDPSSVIVKADPRTNRVFINGPKAYVEHLQKLIHEFDEPSRVKSLLTQQLRYIPVNQFFNTALTALETSGAGSASGGGGGAAAGAAGGAGRNNGNRGGGDFGAQGGAGGNRAGTNAFGSNSGSTSSSSSRSRTSSGLSGGSSGSGGSSTLEAPMAQSVGKTLLISDPRTNSLIVSGPPDSIQRVSDLVKEMDRRPYQVHINAVIAQMAIGNSMSTTVDMLRKVESLTIGGQTVNAAGFFRSGSSGTFIDPTTLINNAAFPTAGSGLNLYAAAGDLFNAYVNTLGTTSKTKLLAKPHITVANNETGVISSGTRVPIPSNQQSTVVAGGTTSLNSSVTYEEVVLELSVRPLINSKNEITLEIDQVNDSLGATVNISGSEIPNIDHQLLQTKITVPNGAILVLGGLISDSEQKSNTGVPILSKIPVIKYLIGTNSKTKSRRELVILLQARIIESADDIVDVSASELQRTVVGPAAELFTDPGRNTDNVKLPTYERDLPFNNSGTNIAPMELPPPPVVPAVPASTGKKAVKTQKR